MTPGTIGTVVGIEAATPAPPPSSTNAGEHRITAMTIAAWASVGAGAIHAAAIGVHAEHRTAALTFAAVAGFQLAWGVLALAVPHRLVALVGATASLAFIGGYLLAKTSGIGFVEGLDVAESPQVPDTVAAVLAAIVAAAGLASAARWSWQPLQRATAGVAIVAVVGLTLPGLVGASSHSHDHGAGADGHVHASVDLTSGDGSSHVHDPAPVPPKPYDPELPIDLGGVEGVTPQQQAAAENLIAITLARLPKYADPAAAEADGFHSIRDGLTGHEHYVNWSYIDDDQILNPDRPESLVYEMRDGNKTLVSAMYMLRTGDTLDDVPELGGPLTQWHIHDNLCFTDDPVAPIVAGLTNAAGGCTPPLVKLAEVPMIHVWIVPHPCGPFAALDGIGAGQIAGGEERLCDHVHGA